MTPAPISVDGAPAKVHRYDPRITPNLKTGRVDYDGMAAFPNGKWVLHSDYAALLQQLAELKEDVQDLRDDLERAQREHVDAQSRLRAAERARDGACRMLREIHDSLQLNEKANATIAAFLAASGGA